MGLKMDTNSIVKQEMRVLFAVNRQRIVSMNCIVEGK